MISPSTDFSNLSLELRIILTLGPIILCFASIFMSGHLAVGKNFSMLTAALPKTIELDTAAKNFNLRFLKFRLRLIYRLCAVILFPAFSIRNNILDQKEYYSLPSFLRRRMIVSCWLAIIGLCWGTVTYSII